LHQIAVFGSILRGFVRSFERPGPGGHERRPVVEAIELLKFFKML
jgi:hypothetical protein